MSRQFIIGIAAAFVFMVASAVAEAYSIPQDKVDTQKVYYGSPAEFERPAEVHYERIVRATPEFEEIRKKKIESGTARYWILISKASDHAVRLISEIGRELEHDLIVAKDYLSELELPVEADDLTDVVLARLEAGN